MLVNLHLTLYTITIHGSKSSLSLTVFNYRGHKDKIFVIKWNPFSSDQLVTVGIKHIKFWTQTGGGFTSKRGIFGNVSKQDTMLCVTYGKTAEVVYSGGTSGQVFVWEGNTLKEVIKAHQGTVMALQTLEKVEHCFQMTWVVQMKTSSLAYTGNFLKLLNQLSGFAFNFKLWLSLISL